MGLFRSHRGPEPLRWPKFGTFVAYDREDLNSTARFLASLKDAIPLLEDAMGGHWLVLGAQSPWIEAILLEYGVQWSSVEHSGLGMYGDEINPWGDRQSVAQLWCRGRRKAWFFFGPGPEGPGGSVWGRSLHNENRRLERDSWATD
eukprot:Skav217990  [mRNA]  locus=scaffold3329:93009:95071:- [translate_table: standard]